MKETFDMGFTVSDVKGAITPLVFNVQRDRKPPSACAMFPSR